MKYRKMETIKPSEECEPNYSTLVTNGTPKSTDNRTIGVVLETPIDAYNKEDTLSTEGTTEVIQKFVIGMPTNCKDLQLLGHRLNGFYSVKTQLPNQISGKIETVYCDFHQASSNLKGILRVSTD